MIALDGPQAMLLVRDYCCSRCWGHLVLRFAPNRQYYVDCFRCGKDTPGYVTKNYVDKRKSDDIGEKTEVSQLLKNLNVIPDPLKDKSTEQLLHELGF